MEDPGSQSALDLQYIKLLRLCLLQVGGWPNLRRRNQPSLFNVHTIYIIIQLFVVIGEIIYLRDIVGVVEFLVAGDVYITTFLTILSLVRLSLPHFKTYYNIFKKFITEFHLIYFKNKGESFKKVSSTVDTISLYYTIFMTSTVLSGLVLFNLSPMYVNVKNGAFTTNRHNLDNLTLEFSVKYKYPGYDHKEKFIITTIINFYLSFLCSLSIISIDLLLILMIFQIIGHLEILAMNLRSMPTPKTVYQIRGIRNEKNHVIDIEILDEEENFEIKQRLREHVVHHNLIISFTENMSNFFGPMLGFNYSFHLVSCCLLLLECTRGDPDVMVRFGPLTTVVFMQLIQISIIFEVVGIKSNALINCVYGLPWQSMSRDNQRIVYIMLRRVQTPIQVTALGLADVGVKTMANILKTTFSYYTFLRSL